MKARIESLALPDVDYDDGVDLHLGRTLQVRYFPAHGGHSVVIVSGANIVFSGDLLWKDHFPNLIDASTDKWIETLSAFQAQFGTSTLVPGHGGVAGADDVAAFKSYLTDLRSAIKKAQADGKSGDALVDEFSQRFIEIRKIGMVKHSSVPIFFKPPPDSPAARGFLKFSPKKETLARAPSVTHFHNLLNRAIALIDRAIGVCPRPHPIAMEMCPNRCRPITQGRSAAGHSGSESESYS